MNESVAPLRLPPDSGCETEWKATELSRTHRRVFYSDPEPRPGQVQNVIALVGPLQPGPATRWRFSVGLPLRTEDGGWGLRTIGYGDTTDEDEALKRATDMALSFLDNPVIPSEAPPIPNLDLVTAADPDWCHTCSGPERQTTEMICMECGTDFMADPPRKLTGHGLKVLRAAFAEIERLREELAAGNASDGYHTHNELYEHRLMLNAHLAQRWHAEGWPVVKSWNHHTGEPCLGGGWFIVVMELVTGQVSYHYPAWAWDLFRVPAEDVPPPWDGHTAPVAAQRMRDAISLFPANAKLMQRPCDNTEPHDPHPYSWSLVLWCGRHRPNLETP